MGKQVRNLIMALAALAGTGLAASPALAASAQPAATVVTTQPAATASSGTPPGNSGSGNQRWVSRYDSFAHSDDQAQAVAMSPDGSTVYVTGWSNGIYSGVDYATVAYNTTTGAQLWVSRYDGVPGGYQNAENKPYAITVSPDGQTVYVTGMGSPDGYEYATVAYDAATGAQLWVSTYGQPGYTYGQAAHAIAVSPDGSTVYVTGQSFNSAETSDGYATVAYNAATGAQLWVSRYDNPAFPNGSATSVAVSPDGGTVLVTGRAAVSSGYGYLTIAYDATTGAQLWMSPYSGAAASPYGAATSVAISPDGTTVLVTGQSDGNGTGADYATVAYNIATGAQLWVSRYNGPGNGDDIATSLAVSANGTKVYVTGSSVGSAPAYYPTNTDYATVAYNAGSGAQLWTQRYNGPNNGNDSANAVVTSPSGGGVFVTGASQVNDAVGDDYATVAYNG